MEQDMTTREWYIAGAHLNQQHESVLTAKSTPQPLTSHGITKTEDTNRQIKTQTLWNCKDQPLAFQINTVTTYDETNVTQPHAR